MAGRTASRKIVFNPVSEPRVIRERQKQASSATTTITDDQSVLSTTSTVTMETYQALEDKFKVMEEEHKKTNQSLQTILDHLNCMNNGQANQNSQPDSTTTAGAGGIQHSSGKRL